MIATCFRRVHSEAWFKIHDWINLWQNRWKHPLLILSFCVYISSGWRYVLRLYIMLIYEFIDIWLKMKTAVLCQRHQRLHFMPQNFRKISWYHFLWIRLQEILQKSPGSRFCVSISPHIPSLWIKTTTLHISEPLQNSESSLWGAYLTFGEITESYCSEPTPTPPSPPA